MVDILLSEGGDDIFDDGKVITVLNSSSPRLAHSFSAGFAA